MNLRILATLLCVVPSLGFAAERTSEARIGVNRVAQAGKRMPTMSVNTAVNKVVNTPSADVNVSQKPRFQSLKRQSLPSLISIKPMKLNILYSERIKSAFRLRQELKTAY